MSLTSHGHCRSTGSVAAALLLRKQVFALGARPALGRYHQVDNTWEHPGSTQHLQEDFQTHWSFGLCKNSSQQRQSWLLSVERAFFICPAWLSSSTSSTASFTDMLLLRAAPSAKQPSAENHPATLHIYLFDQSQLGVCLHGAGVTHSPSPLQCRMHVHKASPQCPQAFVTLSLSAFLRCSSQSKCRISRDSNHPFPELSDSTCEEHACSVKNSLWVQF